MADDDNGANEPGPAGAASQGPQAAGQSQSSNVDFSGFDDEHVLEYVNDISADYNLYVAFLKKGAETAATRVTELTLKARKWRFWLIWLAGGVAILNTMAAFSLFTNYSLGSFPSAETGGDFNVTIAVIFTITAAIAAVTATVLNNIENYRAFNDRATRKREIRELYYAAYVKYNTRWKTAVLPHGAAPQACVSAVLLLESLVIEMTTIRQQAGETSPGKPDGKGSG